MTTLQTLSSAVKVATDAATTATGQANIATIARKATEVAAASVAANAGAVASAAVIAVNINNRIYPGVYDADPTTRPDGSAIQNGDVCTVGAGGVMRVRIAGAWADWTSASAATAQAAADAAMLAEGFAEDWASLTAGDVDGSGHYSAKEYAQGAQAGTGGSAKNWAQQTGGNVTGAGAGSRSAKAWAQEDLTPGAGNMGGSAKDWAQGPGLPDGIHKSALGYALAAAASLANIDARLYPGTFAVAPATRPDGSAIQDGDRYTGTDGYTYARIGGAWVNQTAAAAASATTATAQAGAASTSASAALSAQVAAETARDAALANSRIFSTTAAGIAGTAAGSYFSVPSPTGYLDLYQNNAGVAQFVKTLTVNPEQTYQPSRFSTLLFAVVDAASGAVLEGIDAAGVELGAIGSANKRSSDVTVDLSKIDPRFYSLSYAVYDGATGVLLSGVDSSGGLVSGNVATLQKQATDLQYLAPRFNSLSMAVVDQATGYVLFGVNSSDGLPTGGGSLAVPLSQPYPPASLIHLGALGQSTILGAGPALSTGQPFANKMFDAIEAPANFAAFNPLVETTVETIMPSLTAQVNAARSNPQPFLATLDGQGGAPLTNFIKGSAKYAALMNEVDQALARSLALGESYQYLATCFSQGQADDTAGTPFATYLAMFKVFAQNLQADIQAKTGQTLPVRLLTHQVSTWVQRTTPIAPIAQLQAAKDLPDLISVVGPAYMFPYNAGAASEHFNNHAYRWLGAYFGKAVDYILKTGKPWLPVSPVSVKKYGPRSILAKFNRPNGYPLAFDTVNVTDPNGQKGFEFADDTGAAALVRVELIGDDTVHCVTARDMGANPFLRYAYTVAVGASGGPTTGPRGCLRNTDPLVAYYSDANGQPYKLFDWCVHFSEPIQ